MRWHFTMRAEDFAEAELRRRRFPQSTWRGVRRAAAAIALPTAVLLGLFFWEDASSAAIVPVLLISAAAAGWFGLRPLLHAATYRRRLQKFFRSAANAPLLGEWHFETSPEGFLLGFEWAEVRRPWKAVRKVSITPAYVFLDVTPDDVDTLPIGAEGGGVPAEELVAELKSHLPPKVFE